MNRTEKEISHGKLSRESIQHTPFPWEELMQQVYFCKSKSGRDKYNEYIRTQCRMAFRSGYSVSMIANKTGISTATLFSWKHTDEIRTTRGVTGVRWYQERPVIADHQSAELKITTIGSTENLLLVAAEMLWLSINKPKSTETSWNGKGLPPVGCECDATSEEYEDWFRVEIVYERNGEVVGVVKSPEHFEYDKLIKFSFDYNRARFRLIGNKGNTPAI